MLSKTNKKILNKILTKKYYITQIKNDNDLYLIPKEGYKKVLIFLHGLGDSAYGYKDLFLSENSPAPKNMKIVLLTAPLAPVSINQDQVMNSWYNIMNLNSDNNVNIKDVEKSKERIINAIESERTEAGNIKYSDIILGGFSQGACMTLATGLTFNKNEKLGGLIALSGYLFPFITNNININLMKEYKIFLGHGIDDTIIPENFAKKTYEFFTKNKFSNIKYKSYNEEHGINFDELLDIKNFVSLL